MIEGAEIENHPSHPWPGHKLKMVNIERPFRCDGCLELGFGSCYTCTEDSTSSTAACNFHLHIDCARAWTEVTTSHPFFPKHQFHFHEKGWPDRYCDACGRDINGYVYHCHEKKPYDYDLHPCCAKLPRVLSCRPDVVSQDGEEVTLVLKKKVSSKCCKCGEKKLWVGEKEKNTWSYVSENKEVHFHVACLKEICESWQLDHGLQIERSWDAAAASCPKLQVKLYKESKYWRGKFGMLKKVLKLALTFAIAAVIGDPTAMVVALVTSLITH